MFIQHACIVCFERLNDETFVELSLSLSLLSLYSNLNRHIRHYSKRLPEDQYRIDDFYPVFNERVLVC